MPSLPREAGRETSRYECGESDKVGSAQPTAFLGIRGYHDQMHVIGHQKPAVDGDVESPTSIANPREIAAAIVIGEEDVLLAVAWPGDLMGHAEHDDARHAKHAHRHITAPNRASRTRSCPDIRPSCVIALISLVCHVGCARSTFTTVTADDHLNHHSIRHQLPVDVQVQPIGLRKTSSGASLFDVAVTGESRAALAIATLIARRSHHVPEQWIKINDSKGRNLKVGSDREMASRIPYLIATGSIESQTMTLVVPIYLAGVSLKSGHAYRIGLLDNAALQSVAASLQFTVGVSEETLTSTYVETIHLVPGKRR